MKQYSALAGLALILVASPAKSQTAIMPPEFRAVNDQSINLLSAGDSLQAVTMDITDPILKINGVAGPVNYIRYMTKSGPWLDNFRWLIDDTQLPTVYVMIENKMHMFSSMYPNQVIAGVSYFADADGNRLGITSVGGVNRWQYIGKDGMTALFDPDLKVAISATYPSGLSRTFNYKSIPVYQGYVTRLQSMSQSDGTMAKFSYVSDDYNADPGGWQKLTTISLINQAFQYCDPAADHCGFSSGDWPTATFSGQTQAPSGQFSYETTSLSTGNASNRYGKVFKRDSSGRVVGVSNVYPYVENLSIGYSTIYRVTQTTSSRGDFRQYTSTTSDADNYKLTISSTANNANEYYYFRVSSGSSMPTKYVDRIGRQTLYTWTGLDSHLASVTHPEGNSEAYQYDSRYNITLKTITPKPSSGGTAMTEQALYDASCQNANTCNMPNAYIDARGGRTDYTYTAAGKLASEMTAAPFPGSARHLKLYSYDQRTAYVLNSAGSLVSTGQPIWTISSETECQTAAGSSQAVCDPGAPQTVVEYQYAAAGVPDGLLPRGKRVSSGGTSYLTCYAYDRWRHKISETAPNANLQVCP